MIKRQWCYQRRKIVSDDLIRIWGRWGLYSVIISKAGLQKMLEYFTRMPLWAPIDHMIHHVKDIRQYAIRDSIVTHIGGKDRESDTDEMIAK